MMSSCQSFHHIMCGFHNMQLFWFKGCLHFLTLKGCVLNMFADDVTTYAYADNDELLKHKLEAWGMFPGCLFWQWFLLDTPEYKTWYFYFVVYMNSDIAGAKWWQLHSLINVSEAQTGIILDCQRLMINHSDWQYVSDLQWITQIGDQSPLQSTENEFWSVTSELLWGMD